MEVATTDDVNRWIEELARDIACNYLTEYADGAYDERYVVEQRVSSQCWDFVYAWIGRALAIIAWNGDAFDAVSGCECNALGEFTLEVSKMVWDLIEEERNENEE